MNSTLQNYNILRRRISETAETNQTLDPRRNNGNNGMSSPRTGASASTLSGWGRTNWLSGLGRTLKREREATFDASMNNDIKRLHTEDHNKNSQNLIHVPERIVVQLIGLINNKENAKNVWENLDSSLKENPAISFAFLKKGAISFSHLPLHIQNNEKYLKEGLENNLFSFFMLPHELQNNINLAVSAIYQSDFFYSIVFDNKFPKTVIQSEEFWKIGYHKLLRVTENYNCDNEYNHLWNFAPRSIKSNSRIMLEMVSVNPRVAVNIDNSLLEDDNFVQEIIKQNYLALKYLGFSSDSQFPIMYHRFPNNTKQIFKYMKMKGWDIESVVPFEYWSSNNFVREWVICGGHLNHKMSKSVLDNDDIILSYAKAFNYSPQKYERARQKYFYDVSERLLSDKEFVAKICSIENIMPIDFFSRVSKEMIRDNNILLLACATKQIDININDDDIPDDIRISFKSWLRDKYEEYKEIENDRTIFNILCGSAPYTGSKLVILNQYCNIKREIFSYLDFPKGSCHKLVFRAAKVVIL